MNSKLKELIALPEDKATADDDDSLVNELKNSQLIMPIDTISEDPLEFKPVKIANPDNEVFIALFSDENELAKGNVEFNVININTKNVAEIIGDAQDEYFGVAINPFSEYSLAIPLQDFLNLF
ncbi:SseB family protein [Methanobrevibacter sp.]